MKKVIALIMMAVLMMGSLTAFAADNNDRITLKEYNRIKRGVTTLNEVHEKLGVPDRRKLEMMDGSIVLTYVYEKDINDDKESCVYITFVDTIVDCKLEVGLR